MKQPTTQLNVPPQTQGLSNGSIDTATLELLAAWKAEDATTDPEKLREADKEVATFKKAMNENRAASGADCSFRESLLVVDGLDTTRYRASPSRSKG